ncbi:MAG: DUF4382 domain-containing protein [Nitrososphaerota archaeon]|nr:DUF4382 domain-containing protein [Nitrososphaerota archaeon]
MAAITGVIVLVVLIAVSVWAFAPQLLSPQQSTGGNGGSGNTSTNTSQPPTSGGTTTSGGAASTGQMALMATDPPMTASGVSRTVVHYNNLAVHQESSGSASGSSSASSSSGWTRFNVTGSLDLMAVVNVSKTIAVADIDAGTYNMVRFNITSASVIYNGQNYTATVRTGELTIHTTGNIQVNSSESTAALIDLRTFVVNSGNSSNPQFYISASAVATEVPAQATTSADMQVGATADLNGAAWFQSFEEQTSAKLIITGISLSSNSLSLTVSNTGGSKANVKTVIVTPVKMGVKANASLPSSLAGSAVFTAQGTSLQSSSSLSLESLLGVAGLNVTANSSSTLSFSGAIGLNLGLGLGQSSGIVSGQEYLVTVLGDSTFASTTVVAG